MRTKYPPITAETLARTFRYRLTGQKGVYTWCGSFAADGSAHMHGGVSGKEKSRCIRIESLRYDKSKPLRSPEVS